MKTEADHRFGELTRILSDLALPHPPLERFKLASRLWRFVAGLSREEQKQLLQEFGMKEVAHLEQLAEGRMGAMPTTFLEFIERGAKTLTPERINAVLAALAADNQAPRPAAPPPEIPLEPVDERQVHPYGVISDVPPVTPSSASTLTPESGAGEEEAGAPVTTDEPIAKVEITRFPTRGEEPVTRLAPEQDVKKETIAAELREDEVAEGPTPLPGWTREPRLPSALSVVQVLTERCTRLDSAWKRRRFWLDVIRRGVEDQDVDALLRAISNSGLPPQDYVWVVDEMVVRGLLPGRLFQVAVELAPSEGAARLLQRRLLTLSGAWAGEFQERSG